LVFRDQNGNYHAYQLKFSDSADNLQTLVKDFYVKHGSNTQQFQYPPGLKLEDIKIIVPDGVPVDPVKVIIKDSSGKQITKTVNPSSGIELGDIKLKSPSKSETVEHLKNSFEEIKKSTKMFDNWAEKLRNINDQGKRVVNLGRQIGKLTKKIEELSQTVERLQGEKRSKMEYNIRKMNNNLEKL
jgi:predicted RNase H-like nuclease (RuvC/YqgF family)